MKPPADRYHRQTLLPQLGVAGQRRLAASRVLLVGCGALGTVIGEHLVRAGVGLIRIVDRDVVELSNLQRQTLFEERDAAEGVPKAVAAQRRLARINSEVTVESVVAHVDSGNAEELAGVGGEAAAARVDLLLDGTDNAETRYLINDVSVKHGVPWVYGACVGMEGRVMAVRPRETACLRCLFPDPPAPGELPTCDTAGVLGPLAGMVGSMQAVAAIKLLSGNASAVAPEMVTVDAWAGRFRSIDMTDARRSDCRTCGSRHFEFLERGAVGRAPVSLCGRNAVQVQPQQRGDIDLALLATRLSNFGAVTRTPYLLRVDLADGEPLDLTVFADGRLIVAGTTDLNRARSIYARYIGL